MSFPRYFVFQEVELNLPDWKEKICIKIPKPEYTAEFKKLAVKRVKDGQGIGAVAKDLGLHAHCIRTQYL